MRVLLSVLCMVVGAAGVLDVDMSGYILYCPCMGRFGNQAEHFLGVMSFAKGLNRTLVLPPWVEYRPGQARSVQVPFKTYFSVEAVNEYHRAITMEDFMKDLAPKIWPKGKRTVYCYTSRRGSDTAPDGGCNAKDGNPFGPFWDTFNVDFVASEYYGPMDYDTLNPTSAKRWNEKFPVRSHPVLAFTGAPAAFPVRERDVPNHAFLRWAPAIQDTVSAYIADNLQRPFIAIHLRNGMDFKRACEHVADSKGRNMFGSAQCLGYRNELGELTEELCYPSKNIIIKQVKAAVKKYKAKSVFIATDSDPMLEEFQKKIKKVQFVSRYERDMYEPKNSPHVDLAIAAEADHYICNCVSTFSAFATRQRRLLGRSVEFWAMQIQKAEMEDVNDKVEL